ncbi:unnamed protein product [Adineta ricciae]|uniref:NAD(P)(+)--arginine ADP-ribosyltransferase n=1 Tax=Adineta ricciae TaxID=249248 RepID=A0A813VHN6_ADIRI|nr:unnamed protein product [Adineta ricciae]
MVSVNVNDVELKSIIGYSDLIEQPLAAFSPVQGYEHMPLVTLEEAVQPLLSIVPDIEQMLGTVHETSRDTQDGLTRNESASIILYSINWQPKEHSFNLLLNRILRDQNREKLKPWLLYLKLFMTSLSKLPSLHCYAYRGVQTDLSDVYSQGKIFTWWGFSLCSQSIEVFDREQENAPRTRFKIECKSAKDIRHHVSHQTKDTILLLSSQNYKVLSNLDAGNGLHTIHVKEVDSSASNDHRASMSLSFSQRIPSLSISIRDSSFRSVVLKLTGSSKTYQNPHLQDLLTLCKPNCIIDLSVHELIDQDMSIIVQRAVLDKKCTGLYLTGNKLTNQGVSFLSDALHHNFILTELDLSDNYISDDGVKSLMNVLLTNKSKLEKLHFGSNQITDQGLQYLSDMLKTNRSLTHLMLNRNQITNHGVHILSNVLALQNISLEVLSLASNSLITDQCVDSLIFMLKHNETLKALDMKYCSISEHHSQRLQQAVNTKNSFKLFSSRQESACIIS